MNIRLLAKEAKCSPATVSRVLNNFPYVKPELRQRVLFTAQKLNYSLAKNCFLIIIPENPEFCGYLGLVLNALHKEAVLRNYHLTVMKESDLLSGGGAYLFDGCIAIAYKSGLEKRWSKDYIMPMVSLNSYGHRSDNILEVSSDNKQGIYTVMKYLQDNNHTNIALLNLDTRSQNEARDILERNNFYLEYMHENLPDGLGAIFESSPGKYEIYNNIIKKGFTAVFVPGEGSLPVLYHDLKQAGIRIPDDLSVVTMSHGFFYGALEPALCAIQQNYTVLAEYTFDILENIRNKKTVQNKKVPYTFIYGMSVKKLPFF
ncbi:MAG: LacI family DNA-binding transcriptional regulator [Lentisphaeria bacterium]|nr:LacI family DNA-binding transcriptional regulator [Lentisphaeria bacterium]